MMESVEDIPGDAILDGLPWDWETYGEYLDSIDRLPKGLNVGGMVGHCAVRLHADGGAQPRRGAGHRRRHRRHGELVDEAMGAGALGFSTSRTLLHRVPDGRPVPGTWATPDELFAIAEVLGRHGRGVFEGASRLGERDGDDLAGTRAEVALMGEMSRRSGRPVTFGLTQSNRRPELFRQVVDFAKEENAPAPTCGRRPRRAASASCSASRTARRSTAARRGRRCAACRCRRSSRCCATRRAARS